jgi:hypothetical protein
MPSTNQNGLTNCIIYPAFDLLVFGFGDGLEDKIAVFD